jgi:DnaD/phage-associated family protein
MTDGGKTLFILENKYGNDGYAFWFKILELLANTEGHKYDCSDSYNYEFLVAKTHINKEMADEILNLLADLDAIDKELWKHKIIWSDNFIKNITDAYERRKVKLPEKPKINSLCIQKPSSTVVNVYNNSSENENDVVNVNINPQSILNESILNETITEENSTATDEDFKKVQNHFDKNIHPMTPMEAEKINDWLKDVQADVIILAINEAVSKAALNWSYINTILNNWHNKGYKTLEQVEAYQREWKIQQQKKQQEKNKPKDNYKLMKLHDPNYDEDLNKYIKNVAPKEDLSQFYTNFGNGGTQ